MATVRGFGSCRTAISKKPLVKAGFVTGPAGIMTKYLFSRRVVGWSMRAAMTAQLVTDALVMAIWRRGKPDALLHHSDRGSQYTSEQFQKLMADHGVVCSMSRSGNVWDNAAMESFFSSLKTERTGRKTYRTRDEARADVFDYIERF
jgi:putative transposase